MRRRFLRYREWVRERWWVPPLAVVLAGAAGWAALMLGKPLYRRWRSAHAVEQAREFLKAKDLPRAGVALQVAFQSEPTLESYRLMGDYLEASGSGQAVTVRRLASQMSPQDVRLKFDLARTALRFNDLEAAREAFASFGPADRTGLEFRRAEATYSLLAGEWIRAARLLAEIKREAPIDAGIRLLDDSLNIRDPNRRIAGTARTDLRELARDPAQRLAALRVLLADAVSRRYPVDAGEFGRAMAATLEAPLSDQLAAATAEDLAFPAKGADDSLLARIHAQALESPQAAAGFGRWLFLEKGPEPTAAWLAQLPRNLAQTAAIIALDAEVSAARGDWKSLRRELEHGAWGPISPQGLDFAFAARILLPGADLDLANDVWSEALKECAGSESSLRLLARLADIWKWPDGMQAALLATVREFPTDNVAAQRLIGLYRARRDTRDLLSLLSKQRDALPPSDRRSADCALLELLLSPSSRPSQATRTLNELYQKNPADPYIATDHAFALWELGAVREACAEIDRLDPDDRLYPLRAPYLAVIYASAGRWQEAKAALLRAPRSDTLLPEEARLVGRASAMVLR